MGRTGCRFCGICSDLLERHALHAGKFPEVRRDHHRPGCAVVEVERATVEH
jgi:hypothetical protein